MGTGGRQRAGSSRGRPGQSLVEIVVACGILATAVSAAITLVASSINGEKYSEMGIVAANLAREGIEAARAMRDTNWLNGRPWDEGFTGENDDYVGILIFDPETGEWSVDFTPHYPEENETRVYRYVAGDLPVTVGLHVQAMEQPENTIVSPFRRLIVLDAICDDEDRSVKESGQACDEKIGVRVRSRVFWFLAGAQRELTLEESLYDWR